MESLIHIYQYSKIQKHYQILVHYYLLNHWSLILIDFHQNIFEIKYESKKNSNIILSNLSDKKTRYSKYNEAVLKLQIK